MAARTGEPRANLRTDFRPLNLQVPYHAPCQLRAHRVGKPALAIMQMIPGLEIAESHARCCGIAGTYGYKTEKYQIAMDVGEELFHFVREQGDACSTPPAIPKPAAGSLNMARPAQPSPHRNAGGRLWSL